MTYALISGHPDAAEWLLLLSVILFAVLVVIAFTRRSIESALLPAGLACLALAFLVL